MRLLHNEYEKTITTSLQISRWQKVIVKYKQIYGTVFGVARIQVHRLYYIAVPTYPCNYAIAQRVVKGTICILVWFSLMNYIGHSTLKY
jgi:hypothetical protein